MREKSRVEFWNHLGLSTLTFADLGLHPRSTDLEVWRKCQEAELILITANRNEDAPDSLETTIRTQGNSRSLPVFTLANANRVLTDRAYAEAVADRLLDYLFDIENLRGVGRIYLP
jgi:hypothetical protein